MHFWIDKRTTCGYNGRHRVPSSISSGRSRGRVCASGSRKGMAAPVHRFTPLDCPPRRPHRPRLNNGPTIPPVHHSSRRQPEEPSLYVEIPPEPPQPTIASLAAARSVTPDTLLRTAALGLHHSHSMIAPQLKFGMLVSFALASLFLAGAKYYFDKPAVRESWSSGEAAVVLAGVACVCGVWCAARRQADQEPPALHTPDRVTSTARRGQDLQEPPPLEPPPPPASSGAPPPYHIAVLLPSARADDRDPPEYAALTGGVASSIASGVAS